MDELIDRIAKAFPTEGPPERIVVHECDECDRVHDDFGGKAWTEVAPDVIQYHQDSLPFFSPEAFAYYIPAYLRFTLQNPSTGVGEHVMFGLEPSDLKRREVGGFTDEQRIVILHVAGWLSARSNGYYDDNMAKIGPYWS